jgi:hypothetical protein
LAHLGLRHDQRDFAVPVDADEGIGYERRAAVARSRTGTCRLRRGYVEAKKEPATEGSAYLEDRAPRHRIPMDGSIYRSRNRHL